MRKKTVSLGKITFFWLKLIFSIFLFLVVVPAIFYYCYLFGHRILEGEMMGGDTVYHIAMIRPLEEFYPQIPVWFPFGGAGMSLLLGYYVFPYYLAIIGAQLSNLNSAQWVRLLEFLSVPLVCLEIYIYLWVRFKNQVMATIGAFLYPLSSMAYGWISHAGFYAMQLSSALLLPQFLLFDLYLEEELLESEKAVKKRVYLLAFALFMALGFLVHGAIMPNLYLGLPLYVILRTQLLPRKSEKRLFSLLKGVKVLAIFFLLGILAGSFVLIPQQQYFSNQPFTPTYGPEDTPTLPWRQFLGFERLHPSVGSLYTPLFLSLLVSVFALVGIFLALVKRSFLAALGLTTLFYIWWLSSAKFLSAKLPFLRIFILPTCNRAAAIAAIYMTIMAAYGLWSVADVPGVIIRFVGWSLGRINKAGKFAQLGLGKLSFLLASVLVVILSLQSFYFFRPHQIYPSGEGEWGVIESYPGYGTLGMLVPFCLVPGWEGELIHPLTGRKMICQDFMPKGIIDQADVDKWPRNLATATKALDLDQFTRASVSPFLGGVVFSFTKHTDASTVAAAANVAVVNLDWVGVHDRALFLKGGDHSPHEVSEIAKWFGTRYVFLGEGSDEEILNRYPDEAWPVVLRQGGVEIREFKENSGLVTFSPKPAVLVIGSEKEAAYTAVLQAAVERGISFDQALLIEGTSNIDDYSLEELKQFSTLILRGYSYRRQQKAWELLRAFVGNGGTLFIDTGWQYVNKDWGEGPDREGNFLEVALPEPSPVKRTLWGNIGGSWDGTSLRTEIGGGLNLANFGLLAWKDKVWGMALARQEDLRSWAEPVLIAGDKVIIAKGNFGQGRVVWSGMNLFSHAYDKDSQEEYRLIKNIFSFLLESKTIEAGGAGRVSIDREFPDRIEMAFSQVSQKPSFLYWAETFTPNWRAYLLRGGEKEKLKIYRAGPRFKAIRLPKLFGGERLVLEHSRKRIFLIKNLGYHSLG
jgi:hypothetical protein